MTINLYIAGQDRSGLLVVNSAEITRDLNGRASFRGQLEERFEPGYRPTKGSALVVSDGGSPETKYFAGLIWRVVERHHPSTSRLQYDIEARDYNSILSHRLVNAEYENEALSDILDHINENFLSDEGITLSTDSPSPTITERLTFFYETVASVLNRLSTLTGLTWYVDFDKVLHFSTFVSNPAPFGLTDSSGDWRDLEIERSDEDYRNRQHERTEIAVAGEAGSGGEDPTEDPITAFAGQTSFPTKAIIQEMLGITVNDVSKTFIGVDPADSIPSSGYDFYYILGGVGFFELDYGPMAGGEIVRCRYMAGWSPPVPESGDEGSLGNPGVRVITVDDLTEQAARATLEDGSGVWEAIEEQRNIVSIATLTAIAEGRLRQFGSDAVKVRFTTSGEGLEPGQRINIAISKHSLSDDFLIERCVYRWMAGRDEFFWSEVSCTDIEPFGSPTGYLEKLVEQSRIGPGGGGGAGGGGATGGGGNLGRFVIQERPKGAVDGVNTAFQLTYYPVPALIWLRAGGRIMDPWNDYSLSGRDINYTGGVQPKTAEDHWVWYLHNGVRGVSQARRFGGGTDKISWGHQEALRILGNWSFGVWVKLPATAAGTLVMYGFATGSYVLDACPYTFNITGASGAWDLWYTHDDWTVPENVHHIFNSNLGNDVWRYIGISRDVAANTVSLWVGDGQSIALVETWSYAPKGDPGPSTIGTSARSECIVGNRLGTNNGFGLGPFVGTIQEQYMWNACLTEAQHRSAMRGDPSASGLQLSCPTLGASPENDTSANGFDGAVTGTTIVAGH